MLYDETYGSVREKSRNLRSILTGFTVAMVILVGMSLGLGLGVGLHNNNDNNQNLTNPTTPSTTIITTKGKNKYIEYQISKR